MAVSGTTVSRMQALISSPEKLVQSFAESAFPSLKQLAPDQLHTPKPQASELSVEAKPLRQPSSFVSVRAVPAVQVSRDAKLSHVVGLGAGGLTQALHAVSAAFAKQEPSWSQIV